MKMLYFTSIRLIKCPRLALIGSDLSIVAPRYPDGTEPDTPLSRTKPLTALESGTVSFAGPKKAGFRFVLCLGKCPLGLYLYTVGSAEPDSPITARKTIPKGETTQGKKSRL